MEILCLKINQKNQASSYTMNFESSSNLVKNNLPFF